MKHTDALWFLKKEKTTPNLRQFIDHDYIDELPIETALWLQKFDAAYYTGQKNDISAEWSAEEMRASHARNNARRRDVFNNMSRVEWDE